MRLFFTASCIAALIALTGCPQPEDQTKPREGCEFSFSIDGYSGEAVPLEDAVYITVTAPPTVDLTKASPKISVSPGAVYVSNPEKPEFPGTATYTVTAENGGNEIYVVTVNWNGKIDVDFNHAVSWDFAEDTLTLSKSGAGGNPAEKTITADDGYDVYEWYVDNEKKGTANALVLAAANYSTGRHSLTLVVMKDGAYGAKKLSLAIND
jgi:hypothetical protein